MAQGMTKEELLQAVREGRLSGEYADDWKDYEEHEWVQENPEAFLLSAMSEGDDATLDGEPIEYIEQTQPTRDGYDDNMHGLPMKFVFKVGGTVFVAIGEYDSWEGEHFPNGFHEAELVNVPTWLPKRS